MDSDYDQSDRLSHLLTKIEGLCTSQRPDNSRALQADGELRSTVSEMREALSLIRRQWDDSRESIQHLELLKVDLSPGSARLLRELEQTKITLRDTRNAAEEAHREALRLSSFGQILERSDNEIYIFDATSFRLLHVNHGARENLGYSMDELRELTPLDLKPEYTVEQFAELVAPLRSGESGRVHFTTAHRRKNGTLYPVEVHLELSIFENHPAFVAVILDATARRRMEAELLQSREVAIAADRSKSEFLANMSHEIRTPMTAILGYADLLLEEGDITRAPKGRINAIRTIQRNGQYLLSIINDILDLSKIEAGKLSLESISCSPKAIIDDVLSLMSIRSQAKNIVLTAEFETPLPKTIHSDPTRIRQILVNLVGNAIKFTESGHVQIIGRLVQGTDTKVEIDVLDTGIGITPDQLTRLFQPFSQSDSSTTRRFGGTGLGLTISKRLAEMLRGDVHIVESKPGRGTRFRLSLDPGSLKGVPLESLEQHGGEKESVDVQEISGENTAPLAGFRLLLAEDGPDNQRLLLFVLQRAGAEVTVVEHGQQAVEAALVAADLDLPYDVVLMDMQMPVLDGYAATATLREKGYCGPIIAITAHAMSGDREKCLAAGCDDYATKPIERARLIAQIAAFARATTAVVPSV